MTYNNLQAKILEMIKKSQIKSQVFKKTIVLRK